LEKIWKKKKQQQTNVNPKVAPNNPNGKIKKPLNKHNPIDSRYPPSNLSANKTFKSFPIFFTFKFTKKIVPFNRQNP
jgi:hypothetical protein